MYETFSPELQVLGWAEKHTKPHSKSILFSKNNVLAWDGCGLSLPS